MKALICVAAYPTPDGGRALYYVHSRNLYYKASKIDVIVLNFSALKDYFIDNIKVVSLSSYKAKPIKADILICHAANLRNHYIFLQQYGKDYKKKVFFFHGHEILHINKYYPKPYSYMKSNYFKTIFQNIYDFFKILIWRKYYLTNINNIKLIFVSNWIFKQFCHEMKIKKKQLKNYKIIYNSVGKFFEENDYKPKNFKYDFLTIRNYLDESKYCVDLIVKLAEENPHYKFCLIGKGKFFKYYKCPKNMDYIEKELTHEEMKEFMDCSRIALLLTREDTQGLMSCELATYGMPLITSDIEVCKEIFSDCPNKAFINNNYLNLETAVHELKQNCPQAKWKRYYSKNTIQKEIDYIFKI